MKKVFIAIVLVMAVLVVNAQTTTTPAKAPQKETKTAPAAKPAAKTEAAPVKK